MTPQERQRVADLFNRLAQLENNPRERDAEQLIAEGMRHAPHSPYAMVQTILIQEEALERANERIRELEGDGDVAPAQSGGFLDTLRGAFGGNAGTPERVSVPATRRPSGPMGVPPGFRRGAVPAAGEQQQQIGRGGSFLGQAASIAAGVVVGSMVVDALRGQFGSEAGSSASAEQASTQPEAQTELASAEQNQAGYEDAGYDSAGYDDGGGFDAGSDFG